MAVGQTLAEAARQRGLPVVIDAGSWKPGFETLLPLATHVICSANFYPPGCSSPDAALSYLQHLGIPQVAMTRGAEPILYNRQQSWQALPVPQGPVVDTLGAGDIFHGAFCHYGLSQPWPQALTLAAQVASHACRYVGPRPGCSTP
ncbi:Sulfofructose kinase [Halomicronema hongdechloris C2206]|uniref:Sulfofructose kinase n=2 Tax=Halomicronema hongdechloris TaxID=1209493 RepID=A0A1Z3HUY1_9CYAN|nr:Sulfofructose kinase [Halomicronema hongdechloris C2206]